MGVLSGFSSTLGRKITMLVIDIDAWKDPTKHKELVDAFTRRAVRDIAAEVLNQTTGKKFNDTIGLLKALTRDYNPLFFKFRLNPSRLTVDHTKIQTITQLGRNRTLRESWGNALESYSYSGTMGSMVPPSSILNLGISDPRLSEAWLALMIFEKFFVDTNKNVVVVLEHLKTEGFFTRFRTTRDANIPYNIPYDLDFSVFPHKTVNLLTSFGIKSLFDGEMVANFIGAQDTIPFANRVNTVLEIAENKAVGGVSGLLGSLKQG